MGTKKRVINNRKSKSPQRKWSKTHLLFFGITIIGLIITLVSLNKISGEKSALYANASTEKPNIVFILTDDEMMDSVAKMPYLNSRTDWITFDNAFLNNALCCPSRSSILTGQYDSHTGVLNNVPPNDGQKLNEANTLPVWLQQQGGYKTALVGKYLNAYPWNRGNYIPAGWNEWQAFSAPGPGYYNYTLNENGTTRTYGSTADEYSTDVLAAKAVNFINSSQGPFFLFFTPNAPHNPYTPAPRHKGRYVKEPVVHDPSFNEADVSDKPAYIRKLPTLNLASLDKDRRSTWEMMLAVDESMKKIDDALVAKGVADNTIVIFMTDNGYALGEHRWKQKKCPYSTCMRTPLLVRYPGQQGKHVTQLVQNIDLASTIAQFAGVTPGIQQDGMSLVPLIEGTATSWRSELLQRWGGGGGVTVGNPPNFFSIRTEQYLYIEYVNGEKELYDYAIDPYEVNNKAGKPEYATIQSDLVSRLTVLKQKAAAPIPSPTPAI
ncbi:MAG: sulfatase [Candidatus Levybacteria bacterium]|nr:sulfatase [Candidatus Levybacteria bacterium]